MTRNQAAAISPRSRRVVSAKVGPLAHPNKALSASFIEAERDRAMSMRWDHETPRRRTLDAVPFVEPPTPQDLSDARLLYAPRAEWVSDRGDENVLDLI